MDGQEQNKGQAHQRKIWLALLLVVMLCGCQSSGSEPTATATSTPVPPTDTPILTDTPTLTLTPTHTYTPTPNKTATAAARATESAQMLIEEIDAVLHEVGYCTDQGSLGWVQSSPVEITVAEYGTASYVPLHPTQKFSNFALKIDVTWDSQTGLAGCGIVFRAEDDLDQGEQMRFLTLRLSGLPAWDVELWKYDEFQAILTGKVLTSSAINLESGSVNEYLLIADGTTMRIYANGKSLGGVTISRREVGKIAFFTWQESGVTTCEFENGWIWNLD